MGRKKKSKMNQKAARAAAEVLEVKNWCYYCEREFEDEEVLIQHQKARHFKCPVCRYAWAEEGGEERGEDRQRERGGGVKEKGNGKRIERERE